MTSTKGGAFCQSCQTEVIDFSAMTDREVVEYLEKHKTGCGRFRKDQLNTNLTIPKLDNGIFRWRALALSFLSLISIKNLVAQSTNKSSATQNKTYQTVQKDSLTKQQFKPVCLPQVEIIGLTKPLIRSKMGYYTTTMDQMPVMSDTIKKDIKN